MNHIVSNTGISLGHVLFVTDFTPSSELALPYSIALAARYNGKVYIGHVVAPEMYDLGIRTWFPNCASDRENRSGFGRK